MSDPTDDEARFGVNAWVYCRQHLRPHTTGWCTVHNDQKIALTATTRNDAYAECAERGLEIYES